MCCDRSKASIMEKLCIRFTSLTNIKDLELKDLLMSNFPINNLSKIFLNSQLRKPNEAIQNLASLDMRGLLTVQKTSHVSTCDVLGNATVKLSFLR